MIDEGPIILAVTGGRDYRDRDKVWRKLDKFWLKYRFHFLLHGGARGVDTFADEWCDTKPVQSLCARAHWDRDGKRAGPMRNGMMGRLRPIRLVAFPGGTGTAHMRGVAERLGIKIINVR